MDVLRCTLSDVCLNSAHAMDWCAVIHQISIVGRLMTAALGVCEQSLRVGIGSSIIIITCMCRHWVEYVQHYYYYV